MSSTNRNLLAQGAETSGAAEQHDNPWVDDVDLPTQVDPAVSDLRRGRFASHATVLDRTGQVGSVLVQSDAPDGAPEPLARFADEWSSRFGLVSAWSFADEDNLRVGAAVTYDSLAHSASLALPTGLDLPRNLSQGRVLV